jgi:hypothetical protein
VGAVALAEGEGVQVRMGGGPADERQDHQQAGEREGGVDQEGDVDAARQSGLAETIAVLRPRPTAPPAIWHM